MARTNRTPARTKSARSTSNPAVANIIPLTRSKLLHRQLIQAAQAGEHTLTVTLNAEGETLAYLEPVDGGDHSLTLHERIDAERQKVFDAWGVVALAIALVEDDPSTDDDDRLAGALKAAERLLDSASGELWEISNQEQRRVRETAS